MTDEEIDLRAKCQRLETSRNGWLALSFFMGLFLAIQFCAWASNPYKSLRIDYSVTRPQLVFIYSFWNQYKITKYAWGKDIYGGTGWIPIDEHGRLETEAAALNDLDN